MESKDQSTKLTSWLTVGCEPDRQVESWKIEGWSGLSSKLSKVEVNEDDEIEEGQL